MNRLRPGRTVSWVSQARGVRRRKVGTVVAYVPPGGNPWPYLPPGLPRSRLRTSVAVATVGRYLVATDGGPFYCPRSSTLERQNP